MLFDMHSDTGSAGTGAGVCASAAHRIADLTPPLSVVFNVIAFKEVDSINFFNIDNLFVMAQSEGCQARSKAQG
jgi:hypothetical protein